MSARAAQPNIVFIFADDLSYFDVAACGNPDVRTPNIDRLAKRGVMFTTAYNMGSLNPAVCIASRTMLNTGLFLYHAHATRPADWQAQGRYWSQQMHKAGYRTYLTGKWHVNAKYQEIFDVTDTIRPGMANQTPAGYHRPIEGKPDVWSPYDRSRGGYWLGGEHWSAVLGDKSEAFLKEAAHRPEPFFMYLAFNAPHDPRQSPKEYVDSYDVNKITLPGSYMPDYPDRDAIGLGRVGRRPKKKSGKARILRDEALAPIPRTKFAIRTHLREYYAAITYMDVQVGRILDALKATGKLDNTIIVFTADQGLSIGRHGLMGKQDMYEGSLRVPFIIAGPGIPEGQLRTAPIYLQDIMPTTIELATGSAAPGYIEFHSLLPLIKDPHAPSPYPAMFGGYLNLQRAVIQGPDKLILYPTLKKVLLYNLKNDPDEMHDLSSEKESRPVIARLLHALEKLQPEVGDPLNLTGPYAAWQ